MHAICLNQLELTDESKGFSPRKKKVPFSVMYFYYAPFQNNLIVIVGGNRKSVGDATKHTMMNKISKLEILMARVVD